LKFRIAKKKKLYLTFFQFYKMSKLSIVILILAVVISVMAKELPSAKTVVVESASDFCFFLPEKPGKKIGDSEQTAISFCTDNTLAPGAQEFPDGFIQTANIKQVNGFVQITGTFDRNRYKLKASDGGGQFDVNAPDGAVCAGFKNFVNMVEPDEEIYCIRCCDSEHTKKCPTGRSTEGCRAVIGGKY